MIRILGMFLAVIFAILGFIHLYWAAGGRFGGSAAIPTAGGSTSFESFAFRDDFSGSRAFRRNARRDRTT